MFRSLGGPLLTAGSSGPAVLYLFWRCTNRHRPADHLYGLAVDCERSRLFPAEMVCLCPLIFSSQLTFKSGFSFHYSVRRSRTSSDTLSKARRQPTDGLRSGQRSESLGCEDRQLNAIREILILTGRSSLQTSRFRVCSKCTGKAQVGGSPGKDTQLTCRRRGGFATCDPV